MHEISLPYHLIIPSIISILVLGIILYKRQRLFKRGKWKWCWISLTVFFTLYLLIVGRATYVDISLQLTLRKLDLNGDGFFNGNEITPEQKIVSKKLISDVGRNFSFISGLIFSGIIAFFVFVVGKLIEYIKRGKANSINKI